MTLDYFFIWLSNCGIGILLGLFPGYLLFADAVSQAVIIHNKDVPPWMIRLSNGNVKTRKWDLFPFKNPASSHRGSLIISGFWLVFMFGLSQYVIIYEYLIHLDIKMLISEEAGWPVFLLLTGILPAYLTNRYTARLKTFDKKAFYKVPSR